MSTIKEDLIQAREKIEKGWCQGVAARDAKGRSVQSNTNAAVRFCIIGAIHAVSESPAYGIELLHKVLLARDGEYLSLPNYNDAVGRTKKEVLALIDDAIKLAGGA